MESGRTVACKQCQPGSQFCIANDSSKYQGWSKNEGGFDGSVPSKFLKFRMLSPEFALGVAKTMTRSFSETMGVVCTSLSFSSGGNRLGIPSSANRRSTSFGSNEIICDKVPRDMIVSKLVRDFPYATAPRSRIHARF